MPEAIAVEPEEGVLLGVRILVVDDDADARELITAILQGAGAEVRAVVSVGDALQVLAAVGPDVIVSDIGMATNDGYTLARRLRELPEDGGGRTPAIAVTAFAAARDRKLAFAAGFNAFLAKPISSADLVALVAQLVSGRSPVQSR